MRGTYEVEHIPVMSPEMKRVDDLLAAADASDPRRPVFDRKAWSWVFPTAAPTHQTPARVLRNPVTGGTWSPYEPGGNLVKGNLNRGDLE